ncbi:hypothetical protein BDB00DRAFT_875278 [Zychaea mexicana]|uniref:uncharacterized protein n=1 Tax=Zychaea mexicana TaxID=64656 RepID=UPI0022FF3213|nr:uncharacterized protein BDB00DRAFT_875278 [Zychaea mexicana]KAI9490544.1 hypothetical protein BDB00DRAFT_875278 [Zychaea mexicana]
MTTNNGNSSSSSRPQQTLFQIFHTRFWRYTYDRAYVVHINIIIMTIVIVLTAAPTAKVDLYRITWSKRFVLDIMEFLKNPELELFGSIIGNHAIELRMYNHITDADVRQFSQQQQQQ